MNRFFYACAAVTAVSAVAGIPSARAEEQFDVVTGKGEITLVTKGHWHVNKEYPWRVIAGEKTVDKSKFALGDTSAKVSGLPLGAVKLKGAVCDGPQCMPFTKDINLE